MIDRRNADLYHELPFSLTKGEDAFQITSRIELFAFQHLPFFKNRIGGKGFGEDSIEEDILVVGPAVGPLQPVDGAVVDDVEFKVQDPVGGGAFIKIEDHRPLCILFEAVTVHPEPFADGQFRLHLDAVELNPVIPCFCMLIVVREPCPGDPVITVCRCHHAGIARPGQEPDIAVIPHTRTAEVCMAEAIDVVVAVMVSRTCIPVVLACVGAQLHHPERHHGARVSMAVASSADEGVDICCRRLVFRFATTGKDDRNSSKAQKPNQA